MDLFFRKLAVNSVSDFFFFCRPEPASITEQVEVIGTLVKMLIVVVGSSDGEAGTQTAVAVAYGCHDNIFRLSDNLPQPHGKT